MAPALPWRSAACTDQGKVRERNEDAILECPQQGLWAVADGMGGHRAADIVHTPAVSGVPASFMRQSLENAGFDLAALGLALEVRVEIGRAHV